MHFIMKKNPQILKKTKKTFQANGYHPILTVIKAARSNFEGCEDFTF